MLSVTNHEPRTVDLLFGGNPDEAWMTDLRTGRIVSHQGDVRVGTGAGARLAPGQTARGLPVDVDTARCGGTHGSLLPPGRCGVITELTLGTLGDARGPTYLTDPVEVTVTGPSAPPPSTRSWRTMRGMPEGTTGVYIEQGKTRVFAAALDWPGWCRRGKGEQGALDALLDYTERYALVAGPDFAPGPLEIVGRVSGSKTTDFGAPDAKGPWDEERLTPAEVRRQVDLLEASWRYLDTAVAAAPEHLRKGPRGGGRDRDAVVDHVREAERAYGRKVGVAIPPRTAWGEQRQALAAALRAGSATTGWPIRYAIRRCAWHILDHAWEIEDKTPGRPQ